MAKYIIDIPEEIKWIEEIQLIGFGGRLVPVKELTPYTDPDHKAIEDEVWEFAKKVILGRNDGGLSVREIEDCFGSATYSIGVFQKYSYREAKEKYEAWKKQKEAIHVGDEVKHKQHGWKAFVTNISEFGYLTLMRGLGESSSGFNLEDFEKTGKHCAEVEELIKKISENK